MKTAISVPDSIFVEVERHAKSLGVSRSEFFADAARRYIADLDRDGLVAAINAAVDSAGDDDREFVREAAIRTFERNA